MLINLKNKKSLNVEITGEGENIVFFHSFLWDSQMWKPQIEKFSKNYKCINIDLWGHGLSDPLLETDEYTIESLAEDVKEALEILELKEYIYVGLSVGGMIGPVLHSIDKTRMKKLVIMDSYVGLEADQTKNLYFQMLAKVKFDRKIEEVLANQIAPMFFAPENSAKEIDIFKNFKNHLINLNEKNINTIFALGHGIFGRKNNLNLLKEINIPTLFLTGEFDIPRPKEEAIEMSKLVENSKVYIVPNSGHISNLENIEFVNKSLEEFF